jgi:hypothetical protein
VACSRLNFTFLPLPVTYRPGVQSQVSPSGMCGGQTGLGTGFFPHVLQFSSVDIIPPLLHNHSSITDSIITVNDSLVK